MGGRERERNGRGMKDREEIHERMRRNERKGGTQEERTGQEEEEGHRHGRRKGNRNKRVRDGMEWTEKREGER